MIARTVPYLTLIVEALRSIDPTRLAAEGADHGICAAVHEYVKVQALQTPSRVGLPLTCGMPRRMRSSGAGISSQATPCTRCRAV